MKYLVMILLLVSNVCWAGEHLISFTNLKDSYIDFDFSQNKWVYGGDLEAIGKEIEKDIRWSYQAISVVEVYRQLKEETKKERAK